MVYNLIITERANELLDSCVNYMIYKLLNRQAAKHFLDEIEKIYVRLEDNPFQFSDSKDPYLKSKGYREAIIPEMDYKLIFRIDEKSVYVVGIFHDLEDYGVKVIE